MVTHSSIPAWESHGQKNLASYSPQGRPESDTTEVLSSSREDKRASQVALMVKNPPASAGDARDVGSIPGPGRFPEEEMAPQSSVLAWKISWAEEPGGPQSMGPQRVRCNCTQGRQESNLKQSMWHSEKYYKAENKERQGNMKSPLTLCVWVQLVMQIP